jgi:competence protein ComGC
MQNRTARSFVLIMVVIAFTALFLRFVIERIIKMSIIQNESSAAATLKLISTSLENYAKDKKGIFPDNISSLVEAKPAYLEKDYTDGSAVRGYLYECPRLEPAGYSCSAVPARCNLTGKMSYTIATGGLIVSEACNKKE